MVLRIFINIIILISVLYLPWWVTTTAVFTGFLIFKNFYEGIIAGFLLDTLYGAKISQFFGIWFVFTAVYFVGYVIIRRVKKNLRFYGLR